MSAMTPGEAFSRGYDRGNYGAAYESQDWHAWYAENSEPPEGMTPEEIEEHRTGMLLGFHSSLETYEISDPDIAEAVEAARAQYPES